MTLIVVFVSVRLIGVANRLIKLKEMAERKLYLKKNEDRRDAYIDFTITNNYIYCAIYQSSSDVVLRLVNAVLDLGNPPRICSFSTICENAHVKNSKILVALKKIHDLQKTIVL